MKTMMQETLTHDAPPITGGLNTPQRQAVETTEGPVLVLAGAGTGKTRVLTTRIAHILLTKRAFPSQILAVTFTNKAAREMSERVAKLTGGAQSLWLGTFHSIAARILRRHAEQLGLSGNFTILGEDDQIRLLKNIMGEQNIDDKTTPPKLLLAIIQRWKDEGLTPDKITHPNDTQQAGGLAAKLYRMYQDRLRQLDACDFGDLLLHNLTLFSRNEALLSEYSSRFRYILVDEYQDTNISQYMWLRLLALANKNICCVGDDDQSIYSWRGAEVGNILKFERDFPGATIIRLEQNYRSTRHILGAASAVIANNQGRLGKTLWTQEDGGEKIRIRSVWDDNEEARFIGDEIENLQRNKISLNEVAILVRASFQTRAFEERFLSMGIPYRVIGGQKFYERMEIRDAIAYLRVIANPNDDLAFERIINTPKRGVGQATLQQMHSTARTMNASLCRAAEQLIAQGIIKGKLGSAIGKLLADFSRWREKSATLTLSELADLMLEESGYRALWQREKTPESQGRVENLRELLQAMGEFEGLAAFLEHVGLVTATDENSSAEMVSLMTLHAAKGLEFRAVFLPGWEEGLFPHQRALDESGTKGLEEERRLAYVGITRAREWLTITHAGSRRIYNQWQTSIPSRFLTELPAEHVEKSGVGVNTRSGQSGRTLAQQAAEILSGARHKATEAPYSVGRRVFHQKFGYGRIQSVSGDHLEIAFDKAGIKKVLSGFVNAA